MANFRILHPDDARELARLHASTFTSPWSPAAFREELAKPASFALAQLGHDLEIISFVIFQRVLDQGEMLTLATAPAHQKQGHASTLLNTAFDHLKARGVTRCLLDVAADNHAAIALYQKLGFTKDGQRKAYYKRTGQKHIDAILMSSDMTGL